jgi:hypothetical protein
MTLTSDKRVAEIARLRALLKSSHKEHARERRRLFALGDSIFTEIYRHLQSNELRVSVLLANIRRLKDEVAIAIDDPRATGKGAK